MCVIALDGKNEGFACSGKASAHDDIGSVTKTVTANLLAKGLEEGSLDMNDYVDGLLPKKFQKGETEDGGPYYIVSAGDAPRRARAETFWPALTPADSTFKALDDRPRSLFKLHAGLQKRRRDRSALFHRLFGGGINS